MPITFLKKLLSLIIFLSYGSMFAQEDLIADLTANCFAESCEALKSGQLDKFDALVGEASCQLRALKVALIYKKYLSSGISSLSIEEKEFIRLAYMLTKPKCEIKDEFGHSFYDKFDLKKLSNKLSGKTLSKLIYDSQRRLAELSVDSIQKLAQEDHDEDMVKALNYVLIDSEESRFRRKHVGCYPSIKFMLDYIKHHQIPMLVVVRPWQNSLTPYHKILYTSDGSKFTSINFKSINEDDAIVVVEGYSNLLDDNNLSEINKQFEELGIDNVLLGTFATHPQFVSKNREADLPYEQLGLNGIMRDKLKHTELAEKFGCSMNNKKLFLATHIFASTLKEQFPTPAA